MVVVAEGVVAAAERVMVGVAAKRMVVVVAVERMVVVMMFSLATTSLEFVYAIGWLDPQHIHVMFVVILDQTFGFKVMPFG